MEKSPERQQLLNGILPDAIRRGQWQKAESIVLEELQSRPDSPDLLNVLGVALYGQRRTRESLAAFQQATTRRVTFSSAWKNMSAVLAELCDGTPLFDITVITPTIGSQHLGRCMESVQIQTYPYVRHVIVIDGREPAERVGEAVSRVSKNHPQDILPLPQNVGGGGYCGHRVYAAVPFLVDTPYVLFLDEDNWLEHDHVSSLMALVTRHGLAWAYSLRRIMAADGTYLVDDNCESLGHWPTWNDSTQHLVDVNCYVLRRDIAMQYSQLWYRRFRDELNPDFVLCGTLIREQMPYGTTGRATVNYRAGSTVDSVASQFFFRGNEFMKAKYPAAFPWLAEQCFRSAE